MQHRHLLRVIGHPERGNFEHRFPSPSQNSRTVLQTEKPPDFNAGAEEVEADRFVRPSPVYFAHVYPVKGHKSPGGFDSDLPDRRICSTVSQKLFLGRSRRAEHIRRYDSCEQNRNAVRRC